MKPDSESNEPHEITDEQLDALLREVHVPADLKQDLLSIADVDLMVQPKPVSNTSTMGRWCCLLYTSPSPRDQRGSRMPSSA